MTGRKKIGGFPHVESDGAKMFATVCKLGLECIVSKQLMRPAIKSIPHLAPNGMNQVLKRHVIAPASFDGDFNAVPKDRGGFDAVIFSVEDFFGRYRGHALFGHAAIVELSPGPLWPQCRWS